MLTTEERNRYDRQIMMKGLGESGQEKLKRAKVIQELNEGVTCTSSPSLKVF